MFSPRRLCVLIATMTHTSIFTSRTCRGILNKHLHLYSVSFVLCGHCIIPTLCHNSQSLGSTLAYDEFALRYRWFFKERSQIWCREWQNCTQQGLPQMPKSWMVRFYYSFLCYLQIIHVIRSCPSQMKFLGPNESDFCMFTCTESNLSVNYYQK